MCEAKRESSWLGRLIAAEPAGNRRFSKANGRGETSRNALARLVARACGLLPLLLFGAKERLLATAKLRTAVARWRFRNWASQKRHSLGRALSGRSLHCAAFCGDKGRSGTHEQCGPGWLAPGRILIFRGQYVVRDLAPAAGSMRGFSSHAAIGGCNFCECGVRCGSDDSWNEDVLEPQKSLLEESTGKVSDNDRAGSGDRESQQD